MSKVIGIQENDFFDLIEKLNEFNELERVIETQVFPVEGSWYCVVYYENQEDKKKDSSHKPSVSVDEKRILPDIPASQKQKDLLKKIGYKFDTSKISKKQAWLETKKLKELK